MSVPVANRALAWGVPIAVEAAALLRSVLFARLLGADELGQALLLALVLRLVEMASDLGIERLLAQAPDGGSPAFLGQLHGAAVLRGGVLALILLAIAWPTSMAFGAGPAATSYAALALVPALRAFLHLDYRRRERDFDYRGLALVEGAAAGGMLLGAALGVALFGDHRAMLAAVLAQGISQVAFSHALARVPYAIRLDRAALLRLWRFGAPLVLNAGLLFVTLQADRLIVAAHYGFVAVAVYGTAMQLAYMPAQIAGRAAAALLAPRFRIAIAHGALMAAAGRAMLTYLLLGLAFALGFAALAPAAIGWVWGAAFAPSLALAAGLGAAAGLRIARTPLSQLAVSAGRTGDPARANLWRAATLPIALIAALLGWPLAALAWAAALGEALAAGRAALLFVQSTQPMPEEAVA